MKSASLWWTMRFSIRYIITHLIWDSMGFRQFGSHNLITMTSAMDVYFSIQNHSDQTCWSALLKYKDLDLSLAGISRSATNEMTLQGMKKVISYLATPRTIKLYADAIIPSDLDFSPHKIEWHGERTQDQRVHFDRLGHLNQFMFKRWGFVPQIAYIMPVVYKNYWVTFLITGNEELTVISGKDNETDKSPRLHLMAVTNGLLWAPLPPMPICISTDSTYLLSAERGLQGWLHTWRTKHGEPLQNADLWKVVGEQFQQRTLLWRQALPELLALARAYAKLTADQYTQGNQ